MQTIHYTYMSQTLFGNPKGPVELGNPNTCAETKLCLSCVLGKDTLRHFPLLGGLDKQC